MRHCPDFESASLQARNGSELARQPSVTVRPKSETIPAIAAGLTDPGVNTASKYLSWG